MKIPKSYTQFGQVIKVVIDNDHCADHDCNGLADPDKNKIYLAIENPDETSLDKEEIERNFFHESVHIMLAKAGYEELYPDEKFVSVMGNLMYEMLKSGKIIR